MKGHKNKYKPVLSKQTRMHGVRSTQPAHEAVSNEDNTDVLRGICTQRISAFGICG